MRPWMIGSLVMGLSGCMAAVDPCGGPPPAIDACVVGAAWAECGGSGVPPVLGCMGSDYCRWFANGCLAEGYSPACPAANFALAWGSDPWDRARERNLSVVLGPPDTSAGTGLVCQGPTFCCATQCPRLSQAAGDGGATAQFRARPGAVVVTVGIVARSLGGTDVSVEIITDENGERGARVCLAPYTDVTWDACASEHRLGVCAVRGMVTLSHVPTTDADAAATRLAVSATFADGGTLELRL